MMRFAHKAGEKMFIDFSGDKGPLPGPGDGEDHRSGDLCLRPRGKLLSLCSGRPRPDRGALHWLRDESLRVLWRLHRISRAGQFEVGGDPSLLLRAGHQQNLCGHGGHGRRQGISAFYVRMPRLAQELKVARADGSYEKLLQRLQRMRLLIIDDWGLNRFAETRTRSS